MPACRRQGTPTQLPDRNLRFPNAITANPTPIPQDGYPAPVPQPTIDPYPISIEGPVWVLYPIGEKCEKPEASLYASLQDAMSELTLIGVPVMDGEVINLNTCNSCGCPTEEHYRVQIDGESVAAVLNIGWVIEE